jgi:hypothetical protein
MEEHSTKYRQRLFLDADGCHFARDNILRSSIITGMRSINIVCIRFTLICIRHEPLDPPMDGKRKRLPFEDTFILLHPWSKDDDGGRREWDNRNGMQSQYGL